ncbi:small acid-soluble spore protein P [Paenibacillus cymbidii]|nr:small acid-soluble spore protein P [Paenibacillus cymbidii]
MAKNKAVPVNAPGGENNRRERGGAQQEPLSGSKKVKNQNHTRHNNGEG